MSEGVGSVATEIETADTASTYLVIQEQRRKAAKRISSPDLRDWFEKRFGLKSDPDDGPRYD